MRYLLLVCVEEIADPVEEPYDDAAEIERWVTAHDGSGARVWGDRLADAAESRVVRIRAGGATVEAGPLHPAHAAIAGLDILECGSLDEAVAIALDHPMARGGVLEVRPFFDWKAES
ncbi:YciI family protein [Demequina rhizosphaerae]|uniref:YciI family protein n=1 Tax=Demequina rhizosphaerae TaxID=1638985 RepID=UPI0007847FF8|nr:YciI family protein [Demequina rhizosphaerae]